MFSKLVNRKGSKAAGAGSPRGSATSPGEKKKGAMGRARASIMQSAHAVKQKVGIIAHPNRKSEDTSAQLADETPEGRWFTPRLGWPDRHHADHRWVSPPELMPTAADIATAPDLFNVAPAEDDVIGVLRVEVLQAKGLPAMDGGPAILRMGSTQVRARRAASRASHRIRTATPSPADARRDAPRNIPAPPPHAHRPTP